MVSKKSMRKTCPACPTDNVADLPDGMAKTGFQGRKLGESVQVWKRMLADPECTIFFGLSGCTFHEAISWEKESVGTMQVRVHVDATIALPFVISALVCGGVKRVKMRNVKKNVVHGQGM